MVSSVKAAEALPALLGSFANQVGASLAIDPQAKSIYIKGQTVVIPSIEKFSQQVGATNLYDLAAGCVIHAAAKIRYTNQERTSAWHDAYKGHEHQALTAKVHTIIEDAFLRATVAAEMPHLYTACQPMWNLVEQEHANASAKREDDDTDIIADLIFKASQYAASPNSTSAAMLEQITPRAQAIAGDTEVLEVRKLIAGGHLLVDAEAVLSLSTQLLSILGIEPLQPQPESSKKDNPPSPPQQEPQAMEAADQAKPDAAPDQEGQSSGSVGAGLQGEEPDDSDVEPRTSAAESPGQPDGDEEASEEGQEPQLEYSPFDLFEAMAAQDSTEDEQPEDESPLVLMASAGSNLAANDHRIQSIGRELYERVVSSSMMASARLATVLQAYKQSRVTYGRSGKLVAARAWKLKAGSINIFRKEVEGRQLSTAVQILLDRSGSMKGGLSTALDATLFMPLALNSVDGVQTSISIFPGRYGTVENVKGWDERLMSKLDSIASIRADGGTPMTGALKATAQLLTEVNADRKILLVITDGEPDGGALPSSMVVQSLTRSGVEVIGIGIGSGTKNLASIFSESVRIRHVGELTEALVTIFDRYLLQQAA